VEISFTKKTENYFFTEKAELYFSNGWRVEFKQWLYLAIT